MYQRILARFALWVALAILAVLMIETALVPAKGFELTDEALYLIAASQPPINTGWGFPWGWHTAPLYELSGGSIANFRRLGAYLLALIGSFLGLATHWLVEKVRPQQFASRRYLHIDLERFLFLSTGAAGSMFYYVSLLRAPSYNWVNLVGMLISLVALVFTFGMVDQKNKKLMWLVVSVFSFGLFFAAPGKPSTTIGLFFLALVSWGYLSGFRALATRFAQVTLTLSAILIASVASGWWPRDFLRFFVEPLTVRPSLMETHGVSGALARSLSAPIEAIRLALSQNLSSVTNLIVLLMFLLVMLLVRSRPKFSRSAGGFISLGLIVFVAVKDVAVFFIVRPVSFADNRVGFSWLFLGVLILVFLLLHKPSSPPRIGSENIRVLPVAASLLAIAPFIYSFGSGNPVLGMASHSAVTFGLALLVILAGQPPELISGRFLPVAVAAFTMVLVSGSLASSHASPYRLAPMQDQSETIRLNDTGSSELLVDSATKESITTFLQLLAANGFKPGTSVIDLSGDWTSALPYSAGALVPDTYMITLGGYPGSSGLAKWNLEEELSTFDWNHAWVFVNQSQDSKLVSYPNRDLTSYLSKRTQRDFPTGYLYVGSYDEIGIYVPK